MEAQILDIAIGSGKLVLNPVGLVSLVAALLALITGFAGRMVFVAEDFLHHLSRIRLTHDREETAPPEEA